MHETDECGEFYRYLDIYVSDSTVDLLNAASGYFDNCHNIDDNCDSCSKGVNVCKHIMLTQLDRENKTSITCCCTEVCKMRIYTLALN